MMAPHPLIVFGAGLVIVVLGAEFVLRSSVRVAAMLGIRPVVIGLTIVSIGTSTPELAVGIAAVHEGKGTLAAGNIAGTNILNLLFILGLSAAIRPLPIRLESLRVDVPVMIASAFALLVMALDGVLTRAEGVLLVCAAVAYTVALVRSSARESARTRREFAGEFGTGTVSRRPYDAFTWNGALLLGGIALTVFGADLLVNGAVSLALEYGVSDAVVGLTIVAIGTSAPELVTTIIATLRNDRDVAIGNLVGSSVYNILFILGLTMVASPAGVDVSRDVLWIDIPLAAAVAVACLPVFKTDRQVSRKEGIAFVAAYVAYLATLLTLRA